MIERLTDKLTVSRVMSRISSADSLECFTLGSIISREDLTTFEAVTEKKGTGEDRRHGGESLANIIWHS